MYGNEAQASTLRASPAQVSMLTSRPAPGEPGGGGERLLRHVPGTFG
jgi:hypothetical protein